MMSLASKFQKRVRDYQEYGRLVEREKNILWNNLDAMVLPDEFFLRAVRPLYDRNAYLSGMFNKMGAVMYDYALDGPPYQDAHEYLVPFTKLGQEMQLFYLARRKEQEKLKGNEKINFANVFPFGAKMTVHPSDRYIIEKRYNDFSEEAEPDKRTYRVVPLGYLVGMMHIRQSLLTKELSVYETVSLAKGEGNEVLDFWRNANSLTDYSHLFSHKPKPPRKNPPRKPELVKGAAWKPAWGAGF